MRLLVPSLVLVALLAAGCVQPQLASVTDDFPASPEAGTAFVVPDAAQQFAVHLDVPKEGRVAYRVLAQGGARVDACLMPGWDADLWWANHTVPVEACQRAAVIAHKGATLEAGPWSLVIRANGCPGGCRVNAVVNGGTVVSSAQGPPDAARIEALDLARCAVC